MVTLASDFRSSRHQLDVLVLRTSFAEGASGGLGLEKVPPMAEADCKAQCHGCATQTLLSALLRGVSQNEHPQNTPISSSARGNVDLLAIFSLAVVTQLRPTQSQLHRQLRASRTAQTMNLSDVIALR